MKLSPRKDEVQEIVKLLESTEYDGAEALAKDVIKRVGELFADREWYAFATRIGGLVLAWGPLSSEHEVVRFAKAAELGEDSISVKLYSTSSMLARTEVGALGKSKVCLACSHPLGTHEHPKFSGRCALDRCGCKQATT